MASSDGRPGSLQGAELRGRPSEGAAEGMGEMALIDEAAGECDVCQGSTALLQLTQRALQPAAAQFIAG